MHQPSPPLPPVVLMGWKETLLFVVPESRQTLLQPYRPRVPAAGAGWVSWPSLAHICYLGAAVCSQLAGFFLWMHLGEANHNSRFSQGPTLLQATEHIWLRNLLPAALASGFPACRRTFSRKLSWNKHPRLSFGVSKWRMCSGTQQLGQHCSRSPRAGPGRGGERGKRAEEKGNPPWVLSGEKSQIPTHHFLLPPWMTILSVLQLPPFCSLFLAET